MKIPAFINPLSGSARQVKKEIEADSRFALFEVEPKDMAAALKKEIDNGATRILACGGDGTLALAAGHLVDTGVELAVFPGGTLNHFAARMGLPEESRQILDLAAVGEASTVDVGFVNDQIFLNTSSVGAYVHFVRTRNHLEKRMRYTVASLLAGFRRLLRMRSARVNLDGTIIKTPMVFVGVGERELSVPFLGQDKVDGRRGLHLIAILGAGSLSTITLAFNAILRGIEPLSKTRQVENRILESVELNYARRKRKWIPVATDGEIHLLRAPLRYELRSDVLKVVRP